MCNFSCVLQPNSKFLMLYLCYSLLKVTFKGSFQIKSCRFDLFVCILPPSGDILLPFMLSFPYYYYFV